MVAKWMCSMDLIVGQRRDLNASSRRKANLAAAIEAIRVISGLVKGCVANTGFTFDYASHFKPENDA